MFDSLSVNVFSSGASSPNMVTDCLRKLTKWIDIPRQRVWKNPSSGTTSPDEATGCLRKLLCSYCLF